MIKHDTINRRTSEKASNIYEELSSKRTAVLATIGKDLIPHLTVVFFSVDDDFVIRFATKRQTMKHRNLTTYPDVQMLAYDEETQTTIQVSGKAYQVTSREEEQSIIEDMYEIAAENDYVAPPISKIEAGDYVAYKVEPSHISMAILTRPQRGGYDMFETLDFEESDD